MKKKATSRRRIDVNVEELDRIIEAAMRAPLNESEFPAKVHNDGGRAYFFGK